MVEHILFAEPILVLIALKKIPLERLHDHVKLSDEEIIEVLKYLKGKGAVSYTPTFGDGFTTLTNFKITDFGIEVALKKRSLIKEEIQMHQVQINGNSNNVIQGNNNTITQNINTSYSVLKEMITKDSDLNKDHKYELIDILEKFNTIKESGENAFDLINKVKEISVKYAPYFFALLPHVFK